MVKMNRVHRLRSFFLVPLAVSAALVMLLVTGRSQDQPSQVTVKKVPVWQTGEISGAKLFHSYCAACHGQDGKGGGPAASALNTRPPDLTALAKNNGGKFPENHVLLVLSSSESETPVHGSKDMPIWGPIFRTMGADQNLGTLRAHNVAEYLKSIQAK
jgi:mono/diheme cytochrome c family protein